MAAAVGSWVLLDGLTAQAQPGLPAFDPAAQAAERQQREEQDRQREQLRREREATRGALGTAAEDLPLPKVAAPRMSKRDIRRLEIEGADRMRPGFRAQLRQDFEGRALGIEDVEQLLMQITRHYVSRGYVTTRAYIPDQDLSNGTLRVLVVEGRVEAMQQSGVSRNVFPVTQGELLNLRDLEQGIDNLNRLPSRQATLDLLPGTTAGATIVGVREQRSRPWRLNLSADNTGSEGTGKEQVSATLGVDNLLRVGDALSLSHRRSIPYHAGRKASESTMGSISVPWGYQTFTLGGSASSYALQFAAPSGIDLPFDGDSQSLYLRTDRVLHRGQTARVTLYGTITWKSSRNYLMGSLIGVSSRDTVVGDLGANVSRALPGGFFALDTSLAKGLPIFGAARDPRGLPSFAPRSEFWALKLNANWSRGFAWRGLPFTFTSALNGQFGRDVLFGSDQLTIGGIYAVRGFDTTNLAGDTGFTWRNDLAVALPVGRDRAGNPRATFRPYVGLDHGRAWSNVRDLPGFTGPNGSLTGGAIGTSVAAGRYNADVFYARSLDRATGMSRESGRLYFRVNASF
jgi:hemolysin activation/secretion protein